MLATDADFIETMAAEKFAELAILLKEKGYEVASYSGYTFEQLLAENDSDRMELLKQCRYLIDGPFLLAEKSLMVKFRGSKNQRILNVSESLASGQAVCITTGRWAGEY